MIKTQHYSANRSQNNYLGKTIFKSLTFILIESLIHFPVISQFYYIILILPDNSLLFHFQIRFR